MSDIARRKIAVYDGQLVDPFIVTHLDGVFRIETIAHALSMLCRYGGHVSRFYSVAEHCIIVERMIDAVSIQYETSVRVRMRREALTHDASEAYMIDMPSPIKHACEMSAYREHENRLMREMRSWFGLNPDHQDNEVTDADVSLRGTEARQLFRVIHPEWEAKLAPVIPGIQCGTMTPLQAKSAWLLKFGELFPNFKG